MGGFIGEIGGQKITFLTKEQIAQIAKDLSRKAENKTPEEIEAEVKQFMKTKQ
jgi:hypothetical protein